MCRQYVQVFKRNRLESHWHIKKYSMRCIWSMADLNDYKWWRRTKRERSVPPVVGLNILTFFCACDFRFWGSLFDSHFYHFSEWLVGYVWNKFVFGRIKSSVRELFIMEVCAPSSLKDVTSRPRGGFAFDLYSRDAKLGKSMALGGAKMPAAMKTGYCPSTCQPSPDP